MMNLVFRCIRLGSRSWKEAGQMMTLINPVTFGMVGAMAKRSAAVLRVTISIPAWNKYVYNLHLVVPDLAVCLCDFKCF